jgi:hypothetical protein
LGGDLATKANLVIEHEGDVGVLEESVGGEDGVVGLHDAGADLGRGEDAEVELALLAEVERKTLQQKRAEARTGAAADGMEHKEALQRIALLGQLADALGDVFHVLLAHGVVTTARRNKERSEISYYSEVNEVSPYRA